MSQPVNEGEYRSILEGWLEEQGLEYNGSANSFQIDGSTVDNGTIAGRCHVAQARSELSERKLAIVLDWMMEDRRKTLIQSVLEDLGAGTGDDEIDKLIGHLMPADASEEDRLDASCALRHWLHNVKRALEGKPQRNHLMLIFRGPQGCGKSTFVERLLSPLRTLARRDSFAIFTDPFAAVRAHHTYAVFLDEMAMVSRAEANTLKEGISAPFVGGRKMHSEQTRQLRRNASYIAATNTVPPHGLADDTGARRFYSIECGGDLSGARGRYLAHFDPLTIWDSVDANDEAPLRERMRSITLYQNEHLRSRSPLEGMLEQQTERVEDERRFLLVADLCRRLKDHQDAHNIRSPVLIVREAVPRLKALGYKVVNHGNRIRVAGLAWVPEDDVTTSAPPGSTVGWRRGHLKPVT